MLFKKKKWLFFNFQCCGIVIRIIYKYYVKIHVKRNRRVKTDPHFLYLHHYFLMIYRHISCLYVMWSKSPLIEKLKYNKKMKTIYPPLKCAQRDTAVSCLFQRLLRRFAVTEWHVYLYRSEFPIIKICTYYIYIYICIT